MKILLMANSHLPSIGGREIVVHQLAQQYIAKGHQVRLVGPSGVWKHRKIKFGYPLSRWPYISLLGDEASKVTMMTLTKLFSGFDILHAHSTHPMGYVAQKTNWLRPTPLVITPHGEDINVIPEIEFGQRLDPEQDRKIRSALACADKVTSISETITRSLESIGIDQQKVEYIPNGVDLGRFQSPQNMDIRRHLGIPQDAFLVCSIGNYHPRKGHEILVEAMQSLIEVDPNFFLVIAGKKSAEFVARVAASTVSNHIKFLGTLPMPMPWDDGDDVLAAVLRESAAYVSASMNEGAEGLSLALLEAMAAGCCPVVTRISGNRDIIEHGKNGLLVKPGESQELADALLFLKNNQDELHNLSTGANSTVSGYSWSSVADKYLDLYQRVIETS